ncbi:4100_t:CDS:1, partial [Ambispora gerdemannii]
VADFELTINTEEDAFFVRLHKNQLSPKSNGQATANLLFCFQEAVPRY